MTRKARNPVGVIAGTGVVEHFDLSLGLGVRTKFGVANICRSNDDSFFLVPRHGLGHEIPPHMINHRANITALNKLGVKKIIATSAVGSMRKSLRVGELGLAGQFLDFTRGSQGTFFDSVLRHTDMTYPYSQELTYEIAAVSEEISMRIRPGLVYVCAQGPRFETAAEIEMFRSLGGDVIGMTGVPEVVLANELGLEYAAILVVTNWAAGLQKRVTHEEVVREMRKKGPLVKDIILRTIGHLTT